MIDECNRMGWAYYTIHQPNAQPSRLSQGRLSESNPPLESAHQRCQSSALINLNPQNAVA